MRTSPLLLVAALGCAAPRSAIHSSSPGETLSFVEDDYPRALALARAAGRPLFVDAWAPW